MGVSLGILLVPILFIVGSVASGLVSGWKMMLAAGVVALLPWALIVRAAVAASAMDCTFKEVRDALLLVFLGLVVHLLISLAVRGIRCLCCRKAA